MERAAEERDDYVVGAINQKREPLPGGDDELPAAELAAGLGIEQAPGSLIGAGDQETPPGLQEIRPRAGSLALMTRALRDAAEIAHPNRAVDADQSKPIALRDDDARNRPDTVLKYALAFGQKTVAD